MNSTIVLLVAASLALLVPAPVEAGDYNYCEVLYKSLLFYQAQRSGYLYDMSPEVWWRWDSALNDWGPDGEDLRGGYYDAGDHVKFGFPMAYTLTVLQWGIINYEWGYHKCGQYDEAIRAVRWGIDYLKRAHTYPCRLVGQVGYGESDHSYWGRAECMTMGRPAYSIDTDRPGSELWGETAAAFAACYLVFKNFDYDYAYDCLHRAEQLFSCADIHRGTYSDSIPDAANFYKSWGYMDELAWALAWLAKATGDPGYLSAAERYYTDHAQYMSKGLGWDTKVTGAAAILAEISYNSYFKDELKNYCDGIIYGTQRTPKGLIFLGIWGSNRNAANAMLLCAEAVRLNIAPWYQDEVKAQIDYMLGDSGRSFVVGFGYNPPIYPHHRGSSCPADPCDWGTCGWHTFNNGVPNPNILYGALVGGPDEWDNFVDRIDDAVQNEVALDYNAAFQGVVAFLAERY